MIPNLPRSGNYLEDCEDDRLRAEQLKEYENYGTESEADDE